MKEIYEAVDLIDREKLLLFYLLNPNLKYHLKEKGVMIQDAKIILAVLGERRLEQICQDLNETVFDTEFILGGTQNGKRFLGKN